MSTTGQESRAYGEMLQEVEAIATAMEQDDLDLDAMVAKVERGYELIRKMRSRLTVTKEKIEKLRSEFDEENA